MTNPYPPQQFPRYPGPGAPPPPPKPRFGLAARIGMIIGGFALLAVIGHFLPTKTAAAPVAAAPSTGLATVHAAAPAVPAANTGTKTDGIGDGIWVVGTDIAPGTYRSQGSQHGGFEFCSWSTRSEPYSNGHIINFGTANADEPMTVKIDSKVKAFETNNCEPWYKVG